MSSTLKSSLEPLCQVKDIPNRGQALVATRSLDPGVLGVTILEDPAVLLSPIRGSPEDKSGTIPKEFSKFIQPQFWTDYWTYQQLSPEQQEQVRGLYHDESTTKQYVAALSQSISKTFLQQSSLDLQEFITVCMIVRANAVDVDGKRALFPVASRMNHSCRPNCRWFSSTSTNNNSTHVQQKRVVRLVAPIEKDEEFTIDYIESRLTPRKERQVLLQQTKSFACECARCTSPFDDTRRFPCQQQCSSAGVHFVANNSSSTTPTSTQNHFLACNLCHTEASESYQQRCLEKEQTIQLELDELTQLVDNANTEPLSEYNRNRIQQLKPPHPLHHFGTHTLFIVRANKFKHDGNTQGYVQACRDRLHCFEAILNYPNVLSAISCEMLADALLYAEQYAEAEVFYQQTVRILQVTDGTEDRPLSQHAIDKLIQMQQQMQQQQLMTATPRERAASSSESSTSSCALCGAMADKKCARCGRVQYCSKVHQKVHWSHVHKQQCQPKKK